MARTFFASDHHLNHTKIITFTDAYGNRIRGFNTIEGHNNYVISNHNDVVTDEDTVYFLGDLVWKTNKESLALVSQLKGKKRICVGNHDNADWLFRTQLFERVYLWKYFPDHSLIASHVPLTDADLKRTGHNVHGHTHQKSAVELGYGTDFHKYTNVSMEAIDYRPIALEDIY